jgi:DNA primase catalytic core
MSDIPEIYAILLSRGHAQRSLFSNLEGQRQAGREITATCPRCQKAGKFSFSLQKPLWKCWHCGDGGDWLKYLTDREGLPFIEALQLLAQEAGVKLEGVDPEAHRARVRKADLLEDAQALFQEALSRPEGQPVLEYLHARGYTQEDIEGMELGAFTDRAQLRQALQKIGHSPKDIQDSGLLTPGFGDSHQLTLLWRDAAGRAIGIVARPPTDEIEDGTPKYKYSTGLRKDSGLIGFTTVRGTHAVLLVEGVLDALYLNTKGFSAVAVGGTTLSREQARALEVTGTKEILLALDSDEAGQKGTEAIIRQLQGSNLRAYVVSLPDGFKDPDALVRAHGIEAFYPFMEAAERWPKWLARRITSKHQLATDRGMDSALAEAFEAYATIPDILSREAFLESLKDATGLTREAVSARLGQHQELQRDRQAEEALKALTRSLQVKASEGDIRGAEKALTEGLTALRGTRPAFLPEAYRLENLLLDAQGIRDGLRTGFQGVDALVRIPQGALTLLAGRPGHGKTTFLLNFLLNLLEDEAHASKRFFFFSYEEARSRLAMKLLLMMSGHTFSRDFNQAGMLNYLQTKHGTKDTVEPVEKAIRRFKALTDSGRLYLADQRLTAQELASSLGQLVRKEDTGAIIVDYIQKIPTATPASQRYLEVKEASSLLLEQAVQLDVPIILGAQLGRGAAGQARPTLEDIRESGDLEQDANLVLSIFNPVASGRENGSTGFSSSTTQVEILPLKNRGGALGRKAMLDFDPVTLRMGSEDAGRLG